MTNDAQLKIRLPADMRKWLEQQAAINIRSVTGEVLLAIKEKMDRASAPASANE